MLHSTPAQSVWALTRCPVLVLFTCPWRISVFTSRLLKLSKRGGDPDYQCSRSPYPRPPPFEVSRRFSKTYATSGASFPPSPSYTYTVPAMQRPGMSTLANLLGGNCYCPRVCFVLTDIVYQRVSSSSGTVTRWCGYRETFDSGAYRSSLYAFSYSPFPLPFFMGDYIHL